MRASSIITIGTCADAEWSRLHFVIGNGTSTGNGQVEVGNRWRRQINGGTCTVII